VVGWGPGEARTRSDEASRRGGRARTRRDSIPSAMYRVWRVGQKLVEESWQKHRKLIKLKQERARRLDDERTEKRTDERLGARCAGAWLDAAIAPKASQVAWL
jgi:hypothetical protein